MAIIQNITYAIGSLFQGYSWWVVLLTTVFGGLFIATFFNVLAQLVIPQDPSLPPLVFHWVPIFGSAASYGAHQVKFMEKNRKKYGDCFTFIMLGRKMTAVLGTHGNGFVLNGKHSQVNAEDAYTHLTTPVFGKGVAYDVPNAVLIEQKKFIKFGLTVETFRAYVPMIVEECLQYFGKTIGAKKEGEFSPYDSTAELTIMTASRTLQGKEVRSVLDESFAGLYHDLDGGFQPINFIFPNPPIPATYKRDAAQKKMATLYKSVIKQRRGTSDSNNYDMIQNLMTQHYKDGRLLSDDEIAHTMIALLMAGQHTSATTLCWTLLEVGAKPSIWDDLYAEQVAAFGTENITATSPELTYEVIKDKLQLHNQVIKETLRMHPPLVSLIRLVTDTMTYPGSQNDFPNKGRRYIIPKGHYLVACPALSSLDPQLWEQPLDYDPLRWTSERLRGSAVGKDEELVDYGFGAVSTGTTSPYLPFGAGRHRCVGEQFASVQLGAILATLVRLFKEVRLPEGQTVPETDYTTMMAMPKNPPKVSFKWRNDTVVEQARQAAKAEAQAKAANA